MFERANQEISGFSAAFETFRKAYVTAGFAESTCQNYLRSLCQISLHYRKPFDQLTDQQIIDYAYILRERNVSESTLKFLIFAFCFYFKVNKLKERKLPFIGSKKKRKLLKYLVNKK